MTTHTVKDATEQGMDEDDVRRRDAKQTPIVSTFRTPLNNNGGDKHTCVLMRNCDGARGIWKTSEHPDSKEAVKKELRRVQEADFLCNQNQSDHRSSTRTLHRGNDGIRTVGTTDHAVMINGSRRRALTGKSINSNK